MKYHVVLITSLLAMMGCAKLEPQTNRRAPDVPTLNVIDGAGVDEYSEDGVPVRGLRPWRPYLADNVKLIKASADGTKNTVEQKYSQELGTYWILKCITGTETAFFWSPPKETEVQAICQLHRYSHLYEIGSDGQTVTVPAPEPIDVPAAIKGRKVNSDGREECWWVTKDGKLGKSVCYEMGWTCADKSRILLTAEDGKKWCHAPQVQ